jgi:hypothetical protein
MIRLSTVAVLAAKFEPSIRIVFCIVFGVVAVGCGFCSLVLGYADLEFRRGTAESVAKAVRLAPLDAGYLAKSSQFTENREDTIEALRESVRANPRYSWAWTQLGLEEEQTAQTREQAEGHLVRAASVDRGFAPRWALANYHYRNSYRRGGDAQAFWYWTREALASLDQTQLDQSGDIETAGRSALRLAWRMSPDGSVLLARAVPQTKPARHEFLKFLLAEHPTGANFATMSGLLSTAVPEDIAALDAWIQVLLDAGEVAHSTEAWNILCDRRLLAFHRTTESNMLTNAEFGSAPSGRTFDWRFIAIEGVAVSNDPVPGGFGFVLSGRQPERCRILTQRVPVETGRRYVLNYRVQASASPLETGLHWELADARGAETLPAVSGPQQGDSTGALLFTAPAPLITLALDYERPRGQTRLEGLVRVDSMMLRPADGQ